MAIVPEVRAPRVLPQGGISVNAPRGAFSSGEGLDAVAREMGVSGDLIARHVEQQQSVLNKIDADSAVLQAQRAQSAFLDKWQQENPGERAEPNSVAAFDGLEALREEAGANLRSKDAQMLYQTQTRAQTASAIRSVATWSKEQTRVAKNAQLDADADLIANSLTLDNVEEVKAGLGNVFGLKAAYNGMDPKVAQAQMQKALGTGFYNLTTGLAAEDPDKAQAFYDANKGMMNPGQRAQAENLIRSSRVNHDIMSTVDTAIAENLAGSGTVGEAAAGIPAPKTGSRAARNNNPLNLTNLGSGQWEGQVGKDGRFAKFSSPEAGFAAADKNLQAYSKKGIDTLQGVINRWAPPSENDTGAYVSTVARALGVSPQAKLNLSDPAQRKRILSAMAVVEGGSASSGSAMASAPAQLSPAEQLTETLPQTLARFETSIPDPVIRERVTTEYVQRVQRARGIEVMAQGEAKERLMSAGLSSGITDLAQLGKSYSGALEDLAKFSPQGQLTIQKQLSTAANVETEINRDNYKIWYGRLSGPDAAAWATKKIADEPAYSDLTPTQSTQLFKMQQGVINGKAKKPASATAMTATTVANNPMIKTSVPKNKREREVFMGALQGELDQFQNEKKRQPTPIEQANIANGLLSKRVAKGFGAFGMDKKRPNYQTPEYWLNAKHPGTDKTRMEIMTQTLGHEPTAAEIAYYYNRSN